MKQRAEPAATRALLGRRHRCLRRRQGGHRGRVNSGKLIHRDCPQIAPASRPILLCDDRLGREGGGLAGDCRRGRRGRGHSTERPAAPEMLASPTPRTTDADEAAKELTRIAKDQEHDRMRPVLEGRILPWPGRSDGRDHRLEIRVKTHWPLALLS